MKKSNFAYIFVFLITLVIFNGLIWDESSSLQSNRLKIVPKIADYEKIDPISIFGNAALETYFEEHPEVSGYLTSEQMSGNSTHPYVFDTISIDAAGEGHCIELDTVSLHVVIKNSYFNDSSNTAWYGINVDTCHNVKIENCIFENITRNNAYALNINSASNFTINENEFIYCETAVDIESSTNFVITNNHIKQCEDGIYMRSTDLTEIRNNLMEDTSGYPLWMEGGIVNVNIIDNYIYNFVGYFLFDTIENCTISSNHFVNFTWESEYIMNLYRVENCTFAQNIFHNSAGGAFLFEYSNYNNRFIGNSFTAMNDEPILYAQDSINGNIWNQSVGGNYWANYLARYPLAQEVGDSGYYDTPYYFDYDSGTSINLGVNEGDLMPLVENPFDLVALGYKLEELDNEEPTWDEVPGDQEIPFGSGFYYDVNASDNQGIAGYSINDTTNFSISNDGVLTNTSILVPGIYYLEIIVVDTNGNEISQGIAIIYLEQNGTAEDDEPNDEINAVSTKIGAIFLLVILALIFGICEITFGTGYGIIITPFILILGYSPQEMVTTFLLSQIIAPLLTTLLNYLFEKGKFLNPCDNSLGFSWLVKHPRSLREKQSYADEPEDDKFTRFGFEKLPRDAQLVLIVLGTATIGAFITTLINTGFAYSPGFNKAINIYISLSVIAFGSVILIKKRKSPQMSLKITSLIGASIGINKSLVSGGYDPLSVADRIIYGNSKYSANTITRLTKLTINAATLIFFLFGSLIFSQRVFNGRLIWTFMIGIIVASPIAIIIHRKLKKYRLDRYFGLAIIIIGIISFIILLSS